MGNKEERVAANIQAQADAEWDESTKRLHAQLEWYADQALEFEHVARTLNAVCDKALRLLDQIGGSDSFEKAFDRLSTARRLLRERHEQ